MLVDVVLAVYLSRSVIASVQAMSLVTQRITEGHYEKRVQVPGEDELAQPAMRFNQMVEKLNEVEAMRRLIGDVSHELRTLTAIRGSMEGLMDRVLPATEETYQQIYAEADRLNRLVDDLQELSFVDARVYDLEIRHRDVSSFMRTGVKRLAPRFESKCIPLDLSLAPNLPPVLADEDRALQIMTNLTGNASQYTSDNS